MMTEPPRADPTTIGHVDDAVLRAVIDQTWDMVVLWDAAGIVRYVNSAGLRLLGLAEPPATNLTTTDLFAPFTMSTVEDAEHTARANRPWRGLGELRGTGTDAPVPVVLSIFVVRRTAAPDLVAALIRERPRHPQLDAELVDVGAAAHRLTTGQSALARLARLGVSAELDALLAATTAAAATVLGVRSAAVARRGGPTDSALRIDAVTGTLRTDVVVPAGDGSLSGHALAHGELTVCTDAVTEFRFDTAVMSELGFRSGVAVPVAISSGVWGVVVAFGERPGLFGAGEIAFFSAVAAVLSAALERLELDARLRGQNLRDPLTGLPNRSVAYPALEDAIARARRSAGTVALLLLDIDDFTVINDSLGHDAGDRALTEFAQRLTESTRSADAVYRLGGDEFLIVCEAVRDAAHAQVIARGIAAVVASAEESMPAPRSVSIGVALSGPDTTVRELLRRADLAMHRAKDEGGGAVALFNPDDRYDADRVRALSVDLRAALARDELTLAYQPLIEIRTGKIVAVEALARWSHPDLGPIAPSEFVAVAERTGLASALGEWALRTACARAVQWRTFRDVTVRVNVSALQLRDAAFPGLVADVLHETGLAADGLGLEVTETVWLSDSHRVTGNLTALHAMGVALLLDDVGKGHSSLSYLERFPMFECFKIDKSYIDALPSPRARAVVGAIIALAKAYQVTVVGEGVERQEQLDALADAGCDLAQGYLLGRPADDRRTTALLQDTATRTDPG